MRFLVALLLALLPVLGHAEVRQPLSIDQCASQALYGFPTSPKQSVTAICREGYVLLHNNVAHIPVWVAYVLTPEHATGCFPRVSRFVPEPGLPRGASATAKTYAKKGFDIGHMANDSDMRWSAETEEESNIYANAAPQIPGFNRGIWKKLEDTTRGWTISRVHPLQIYIAPVVDRTDPFMPGTDVPIPHGFVKILIDTVTKETAVFYFKHESSQADLGTFITTLADAQKKSGVGFPMPAGATFTPLWNVELKSNRTAKAGVCAIR